MNKLKIGFAFCGSFCTLKEVTIHLKNIKKENYEIVPIVSEIVYSTDTRFGKATDFIKNLEEICDNTVIHDIKQAEPIGPKKLFDALIIAPCTGNTLAKLANGIVDSCVTMAAKAHLRNERPLIIAPSTNDALSNAAKNIGCLLNYKNIFFVPFRQDNPQYKTRSCVADFSKIDETLKLALSGIQVQPIIL